MPFTARTADGSVIYPPQASPGEKHTCPECGEVLSLRRSHERAGAHVAAHFMHSEHDTSCAGESDTHRRMKAIAASVAESRWPEAEIKIEHAIGDRRADVAVLFNDLHSRLGTGVVIECQHRNESKDKDAVEFDMTDAGYTVVWLSQDNFTDASVDLGEVHDWTDPMTSQLPDPSEWSGYHGIVKWLRQEKPTEVEMEVPLFRQIEYVPYLDGAEVFELYRQVISLTEYNYCDCSICGREAVVHVRGPYDASAVRYPDGGFLCSEHADDAPDSDDVSREECGRCGGEYCVGEMYPYRTRWQAIQRRRDHPFDQDGVEWYCRKCAADLPPLSNVRGE